MSQKLIDTFFSLVLFVFVNAAGIFLVVTDDVFNDVEYPTFVILCYVFSYIISLIALFGYRVREVDTLVKLSTPLGRKVELSIKEIKSLQSFLSFIFILKSSSGNYLIWNHLRNADKLNALLMGRNK